MHGGVGTLSNTINVRKRVLALTRIFFSHLFDNIEVFLRRILFQRLYCTILLFTEFILSGYGLKRN